MRRLAEYVWPDAAGNLRSKTKVIGAVDPPEWGFDGSSTGQAGGADSDCILNPVFWTRDPYRNKVDIMVLCDVYNSHGDPGLGNYRVKAANLYSRYKGDEPLFGIEQEYTIYEQARPMCLSRNKFVPSQGPFYCQPGAMGFTVAEEHMELCMRADLMLAGINAEVMPGQWEFQIGPADPLIVADHLMLARFLLERTAKKYHLSISLDAKPHADLNGAGAHTNFSTAAMRGEGGLAFCVDAAKKLGKKACGKTVDISEGIEKTIAWYPEEYGTGYMRRLTGDHETCDFTKFKYGVADRTASVRIPLHVSKNGKGYIEDRRPCANANPYRVVSYIMETCCG